MLQTSDFRGDGTIRTRLTPARRGKKNHIVATIIHKVIDFLVMAAKMANKIKKFQCDDDNSCYRRRIFAAMAPLEPC